MALLDDEYNALFDETLTPEQMGALNWTAALTATTNVLTRLTESIEKGWFANGTAD